MEYNVNVSNPSNCNNNNKYDYSNGKIYKIFTLNSNKIYIGSTIIDLRGRLYQHKREYMLHKQKKRNYVSVFDIFDIDILNSSIELIEKYPCKNSTQLQKKEGEWIRIYREYTVNKNIAGRSRKEYKEETIADFKKRWEKYRTNNKDIIKKMNKIRSKDTIKCCCGVILRRIVFNKHIKTRKHIEKTNSNKFNYILKHNVTKCGKNDMNIEIQYFCHQCFKSIDNAQYCSNCC